MFEMKKAERRKKGAGVTVMHCERGDNIAGGCYRDEVGRFFSQKSVQRENKFLHCLDD